MLCAFRSHCFHALSDVINGFGTVYQIKNPILSDRLRMLTHQHQGKWRARHGTNPLPSTIKRFPFEAHCNVHRLMSELPGIGQGTRQLDSAAICYSPERMDLAPAAQSSSRVHAYHTPLCCNTPGLPMHCSRCQGSVGAQAGGGDDRRSVQRTPKTARMGTRPAARCRTLGGQLMQDFR